MCPDEEIEQTEVAEANKKIVESEQAVVIFFFVKKIRIEQDSFR
mgnify:CR=1 FL=1